MIRMVQTTILIAFCFMVSCSTCRTPSVSRQQVDSGDSASGRKLNLREYLLESSWDEEQSFQLPQPSEITLDNGLNILVIERHDLPMVYVHAQIRGGSIYDPPGKEGLAYLTGWALTEGSELHTGPEIDAAMDARGALISSESFNESCIATFQCLKSDMDDLLGYYAGFITRNSFTEDEVERTKAYITGDLMRMRNDLNELNYRRFRKDLFQDHPYSKPQKGTVESIHNITRQDVLDFYHQYYTPDRSVLVFAGDINPENIKTMAAKYFSDWKPSAVPLPKIGQPRQITEPQIHLIDKPASVQSQIIMGHIGIDKLNPDRFALEVLTQILGGLDGRLMSEVRTKRGLTYGIYGYFPLREFTGEFMVSTYTKNESVGEAISATLEVLNRIRTERVSPSELRDAQQSLIGQFPLAFEEYRGIAEQWIQIKFYNLPENYLTGYAHLIRSITADDVLAAAQKYIHPDTMLINVLGPKTIVQPQLEQIGKVQQVEEF